VTTTPEHEFLILQAQCFYFSRKHNLPAIDPAAYQTWFDARASGLTSSHGFADEDAVLSGADTAAPATTERGGVTEGVLGTLEPQSDSSGVQGRELVGEREEGGNEIAAGVGTGVEGQGDGVVEQAQPQEPPPYPTSFAAIVDLITRNIPVPGIEEIPTTILERGSSKSDQARRRKKPWEKDEEEEEDVKAEGTGWQGDVAGSDVNGHLTSGEGVVKILQPNAIADSGLVAKD
jgi:hypothetical protein